jgi:UDP-GlcNAc:undecaprenyl-phosphate GlcNAc-1-phosphate transferase
MISLITAFFASLLATLLIIRYKHLHASVSGDHNLDGPQKFHTSVVPRIGGLSIVIGLIGATLIQLFIPKNIQFNSALFLACCIPAFGIGLLEDLTKKVGVKTRLIGTAISAGLAGYFFNTWIARLDIPYVDFIFTIPTVSILFTCFAVAGLSNAYNIIDGFNGLASMVAIITLLAIGYVGFAVQDQVIIYLSLIMIGAIAGFFIWNYPRGMIFLGDGGAYLIGFWIAVLSILLISRNNQVSPWFALLANAYPIFETLFTMWRRKIHQGKNPGLPDGVHFHSLIYRRILRWATAGVTKHSNASYILNAKTSPYLWILSSFAVVPAMLWWNSTIILESFTLLFCLSYVWIYQKVVKFKTPGWMK